MDNKRNKIIFVCTGNTCRSPIAQCLMQKAIKDSKLKNKFEIISAGIFANEGSKASNCAKTVMSKSKEIVNHQSQQLTQALVDKAFVVFFMTKYHLEISKKMFSNLPEHCFTIGSFLKADIDVEDPFGGTIEDYKKVRDTIQSAIPNMLNFVLDKYGC